MLPVRILIFGLVCLLFMGFCPLSGAFAPAQISNVDLSPGGDRIVIACDARLGGYYDFVLGEPNRLVIDIKGASLLQAPRKIRVNRAGVREIRLGYYKNRARVVVDFGSSPVPRYRVRSGDRGIVVALSHRPRRSAVPRSRIDAPSVTYKKRRLSSRTSPSKPRRPSRLSIKAARISDGLVVVELRNGSGRKGSCRIVMEVDPARLTLKTAGLSDAKGNRKTFRLVEMPASSSAGVKLTPLLGKRKAVQPASEKPTKKFSWGLPAVRTVEPRPAESRKRGPMRRDQASLRHENMDMTEGEG